MNPLSLLMRACRFGLVFALCFATIPSIARAQAMNDPTLLQALSQTDFPKATPLHKADLDYLRGVAKDTWNCIADLADSSTGLPYDNSERGEFTSVSNIGLYLSSVIGARDCGFVSSDEAKRRIDLTLGSVEKLKTWHGFAQCWNSVKTLQPAPHDAAISLLDTGNFAAALVHVAQTSPAHADRCNKLLNVMEWSWFYDADKGLLRGGYDTQKQQFANGWYVSALATDAQLCQFLAIAAGAAPPDMWDRLDHATETRHGVTYFQPGWQGGGLFMQCISGLWLDERGTVMGRSAENFAYSQILHAKEIGAPVWGWSASAAPDGEYLGWGHLKDEVVTPHASALAIDRFPAQVVANLRALEKLGARPSDKGFVDSANWKTGQVSKNYLMLDQGMLLLSLTNYLNDNSIRREFGSHPMVKQGREKIREFREPSLGERKK